MQYPAKFEADIDAGGYVVTFRDIPEAITQGDDEAEAMMMAEDALLSSMDFYIEGKRPVPPPSPMEEGERMVKLPADVAARVMLLNEMLQHRQVG
jgi:antitoxin HicB